MQPTYVGGESPFDFRHAGLHPSTCVKLGQNCIILGPKPANFPQFKSHGITDTCSYVKRKASIHRVLSDSNFIPIFAQNVCYMHESQYQ